MFVLVAIYLSVTTDTQGSGVYIIFSSTDLPKILIACKCSTSNMYACRSYFHESVFVYRGRKREEKKINDLILNRCMIQIKKKMKIITV